MTRCIHLPFIVLLVVWRNQSILGSDVDLSVTDATCVGNNVTLKCTINPFTTELATWSRNGSNALATCSSVGVCDRNDLTIDGVQYSFTGGSSGIQVAFQIQLVENGIEWICSHNAIPYRYTFEVNTGSCVFTEEKVSPLRTIIVVYTFHCAMAIISILILLWGCNMQKGEMKKRGFSFILSSTIQLKITVKPPERLHPKKKVHNDWLGLKRYNEAKQSLQMIHTMNELEKTNLRVENETQGRNTFNIDIWKTISFPLQSNALAIVHVQQGAELCFAAGYEHKLLGFIKHGLIKSMKDNMEYVIPVTVENRRNNNEDLQFSQSDQTEVKNQIQNFNITLFNTISELRPMRLQLVRNLFKIKQKTNLIEHVEAAFGKQLLVENGFHTFATKIPVISIFFGLYFGAVRAGKGDIAGAIGEILSGFLADIPVVGTTLSLAADTVIQLEDIANDEKKNQKKIKHLTDKDIKDLEEENKKIILKIKKVQADSRIFGDSSNCEISDESYIGYIDDISKIHIKSNDSIVCIQIEYRFGGKTACLDGNEGTLKTMVLEVNEKITSVQVSSNNRVLSSLKFHTDMGKEEIFGKEGENMMSYELTDGHYIGGIKVYTGFLVVDNRNSHVTRRIVRAISFTAKF